jgi:hypothetical protein
VPYDPDDLPLDATERRRVAIAAHGLFADRLEGVAFSEIAEAAGTDAVTVRRSFGRPEQVAAHAFAVHLDQIERATNANVGRDPERPLADGVCEIVRRVRQDRQCARALSQERLGPERANALDMVPIGRVLAAVEPDRPDIELFVDVALSLALADVRRSPAEIAALVTGTANPEVSSADR